MITQILCKSVADYLEYEMGVEMMDPEKINDLVDPNDTLDEEY